MPVLKPAALLANRVEAIRQYHADTGIQRAELDLSGGIDSAVMAGLLVLALGPENVTLAHLGINSNPVQTNRAQRLARGIGCNLAVGDFTKAYELITLQIKVSLADAGYDEAEIDARIARDPTIMGSIRSTLRAPLGRAYNRMTGGGIRHGTGNECEDRFLRFYQKGGDGEVDTNPIAMLSKAETYQLAYELALHFDAQVKTETLGQMSDDSSVKTALLGAANLFATEAKTAYFDTIRALPSADLWGVGDKHNDESEIHNWLGANFTYGRLDVDTGKVVSIGTIERVARFLDEHTVNNDVVGVTYNEVSLFNDRTEPKWAILLAKAKTSKAFKDSGLSDTEIEALLKGARKAERQTRHKLNPNCPQLGSRQELLAAGILSDNFSDYGIQGAQAPVKQPAATVAA